MARCKLTSMNLRNVRKTREYQCLIIDLVNTGVMTKAAAENLLGYTIPAGLLEESGSGESGSGESGSGESGSGESGSGESDENILITILVPGEDPSNPVLTVSVPSGATLGEVLQAHPEGDEVNTVGGRLTGSYAPGYALVTDSSSPASTIVTSGTVFTESTYLYILEPTPAEEDNPGKE